MSAPQYVTGRMRSYMDDPEGVDELEDRNTSDSEPDDGKGEDDDVIGVIQEVYELRRAVRDQNDRMKIMQDQIIGLKKGLDHLTARRNASAFKMRSVLPPSNVGEEVDVGLFEILDVSDDEENSKLEAIQEEENEGSLE